MTYLKRTEDTDEIRKVLLNPEIWERISEYGQSQDEFDPPIDDDIYWLAVRDDNDEIVGMFFLHPESSYTAMVHINILQQHRKEHAANAAYEFLKFVVNETVFEKVHAEIPTINPDVVKFTIKQGFRVEGLSRQSIYKKGEMMDQFRLGITRSEIEQWIKEQEREN